MGAGSSHYLQNSDCVLATKTIQKYDSKNKDDFRGYSEDDILRLKDLHAASVSNCAIRLFESFKCESVTIAYYSTTPKSCHKSFLSLMYFFSCDFEGNVWEVFQDGDEIVMFSSHLSITFLGFSGSINWMGWLPSTAKVKENT